MGTKYKQLCLEDRERIYALKLSGMSYRQIGRLLGRSHRTISREYKRNKLPQKEYIPCKAQGYSDKRLKDQRTKAPLKSPLVFLYVRKHLVEDGWSPQQISGRIELDHPELKISHEAIYQYIYGKGKRYKLWTYLPNRKKKRAHIPGRHTLREVHSKVPNAVSIDKRPTKANNRSQVGHLETDLMEGPRNTKRVLDVITERKTRYTKLTKIDNKKSNTKQKVLTNYIKTLQSLQKSNSPIARSVTSDNGSENFKHKQISKETSMRWYFTHPYHSWEKGSVERTIKEVRRYLPKGTNLNKIRKNQIQWIENRLNNRPMKCLNWNTPNELMLKEANTYKFKRYLKTIGWGTSS